MLRAEDERAIEDLFERLRNVERNSAPRDVEAEALIMERLRQNPSAAYFMAQTIIVQEAALREQQKQLDEQKQDDRGFLGGIFGGGDRPQQRYEQRQEPADMQRPSPWGRPRGGGGFLAGAAQTALGVTGGLLLGSAIGGMFAGGANAAEAEVPPEPAEDPGADQGIDDGGGDWGGDFDIGGEF